MTSAQSALARFRPAVAQEMRDVLRNASGPLDAMQRYHLGWQDAGGSSVDGTAGKFFRPSLCLLCCQALGGEWERALPAAAALEFLHNFSLIHDDIEDNSSFRHGRRTVWDLWGIPLAINAGDAMFTTARLSLHRLAARDHAPATILNAMLLFDQTSQQLCAGQDADLRFEQRSSLSMSEYLSMIAGKTGALIACSAALGAALVPAPAPTVKRFRQFGALLGRAYQIQDDVLGVWGAAERTGKPSGDDIRSRKKSFPIVRALEVAGDGERDRLLAIYAQPQIEGAALAEVRGVFERLGVRTAAERAAQQAANDALALLEAAELVEPARSELIELTRFVAVRDT